MNYNNLSIHEEIRRCLNANNKPMHPANIRRWIEQDRKNRESFAKMQSLDYIKRVMRFMPDVEIIIINGIYYRQLASSKPPGLKEKIKRIKQCLSRLLHRAGLRGNDSMRNIKI